jgi:archaeosine-15-forming tRNA-guanine transglycosylase
MQEILDTIKRPNLRIICIEESENFQLKGPENIFNKMIEENIPNLKKVITINVQKSYRTPNNWTRKENSLLTS